MALCRYCDLCAGTCGYLLTLTSRLNVAAFGFVPDVILTVKSTPNRAAVISGVAAGIGPVLDFGISSSAAEQLPPDLRLDSHFPVTSLSS
jgi:hypothetical protein